MDVAQRDVGVLVEQARFLEENVFLRGEAEARGRGRCPAWRRGRRGRSAGRDRSPATCAHAAQPFGERPHQMAVLLVEALVALGRLFGQVARRRRVRHQHELHFLPGGAVGQRSQVGPVAR